jgi:mRNA-degrading endonuclease RelE of RelBE toxin-antitoxin system
VVEITSEAKQDLKQFEIETREGLLEEIEERLDKDRENSRRLQSN